MINIKMVKTLRDASIDFKNRIKKDLEECACNFTLVGRSEESTLEKIISLFDYILNNNELREVDRLKILVRSSYTEGFSDGMGNRSESESWEESQTKMCIENGFDIENSNSEKLDAMRRHYEGNGRGTSKEEVDKILDKRTQYQLRVKLLEACVISGINLIESLKDTQKKEQSEDNTFLRFIPWLKATKQVLNEKI